MNIRQFTIIIIITFFVGMAWLAFDIIYNTKPSIIISPKLESNLEPVNPNFNARVLDLISEVPEAAPVASAIPIISPQPSRQGSASAELKL